MGQEPSGAVTGAAGGARFIPIQSEMRGFGFDIVRHYLDLLMLKTVKDQDRVEFVLVIILIILLLGTLGLSISSVFS